jgi:hypothetical protein
MLLIDFFFYIKRNVDAKENCCFLCSNLRRKKESEKYKENCRERGRETKKQRIEKILRLPFVSQSAQCLLQRKSTNTAAD